MTTWYLYIIQTRLDHYYTGITTDVSRRFAEHSQGGRKGAKALKGKGPLRLVWQYPMPNKSQALKAELQLKKVGRAQKQRLVEGNAQLADFYSPDTAQ